MRDFLDDWLLSHGPGCSCMVGPDGRLRQVSAQLCDLLGFSEDLLVGRHWLEIIHPDDWGRSSSGAARFHNRLRRLDGTCRWVQWRTRPTEDGWRLCVLHDVTDHKRRRIVDRLVAAALAEASSLADVASKVLELMCGADGWQVGCLWWVDGGARIIRCQATWHAQGIVANDFVDMSRKVSFARSRGLPGRVWARNEPVWITDAREDRSCPELTLASRSGLRSACAVPIRWGAHVVGVAELGSLEVRPRDEATLESLLHVAARLGQFGDLGSVVEALHESEERLDHAVRSAAFMLFACDTFGRVVLHEGGWLGEPQPAWGQLTGQSLFDLYPDCEHPIRRSLERAFAGESATDVLELVERGCSYSLHSAPVRDPERRICGVIFVAAEMAPDKQAELRLAEAHRLPAVGGEITAESVLGEGTTFRVALAASDERAVTVEADPAGAGSSADQEGRRRMLIVDDDCAGAAVMARELGGHDVHVVSSSREALEILRNDKDFDVVLCNLSMPKIIGVVVYGVLKVVEPVLADRIVFMTDGVLTPRARRFLDDVANPRIEKPFPPDMLHEFVRGLPRRQPVAGDPATHRRPSRSRALLGRSSLSEARGLAVTNDI